MSGAQTDGTFGSLRGKRIVVTRAQEQAGDLAARLRSLGAVVNECPAISIAPLDDFTKLDQALQEIDRYNWVIFTSVNGVTAVLERLDTCGKDREALSGRRIGAIGPATAYALEEQGVRPDFVPDTYVAEAIVEQIGDVAGCRVLLPRADIAREALAVGLRERGATVDEVAAYKTVPGEGAALLGELLNRGQVDVVTFTSSSTVRYTLDGIVSSGFDRQEAVEKLNEVDVVCIGPITSKTARDLGIRVSAVATEYTTAGLVEVLVRLYEGQRYVGIE